MVLIGKPSKTTRITSKTKVFASTSMKITRITSKTKGLGTHRGFSEDSEDSQRTLKGLSEDSQRTLVCVSV